MESLIIGPQGGPYNQVVLLDLWPESGTINRGFLDLSKFCQFVDFARFWGFLTICRFLSFFLDFIGFVEFFDISQISVLAVAGLDICKYSWIIGLQTIC